MVCKLYVIAPSPPVRAIRMLANRLNLKLELIEVNVLQGEHLKPEFLKLNPQHTVPTLIDEDGFIIWDSHAIMPYLISKYGKNDSLYPKDPKKRALVDQRLHFDSNVLFAKIRDALRPVVYDGNKSVEKSGIDAIIDAYAFLEAFLENKQWMAGDSVTIADYSLVTSAAAINIVVPIDNAKFPRLYAWLKRAEKLPEYEVTKDGLEAFIKLIKSCLPNL